MRKTILGIIAIVMLLVVILTTTANAALLTVDQERMKKGDIVTVKITTKDSVESMEFKLKFDTTKYQFVKGSVDTELAIVDSNVVGDTLIVSAFDTNTTASTLTVQFKAIENGEAIPFTISNTEFSKDGEEVADAIANPTVRVTVSEPVQEKPEIPVTPEKPNTDEDKKQEETNNENKEVNTNNNEKVDKENTKSTGTYVDENGKKITKLPQTGSYIPSVVTAIVLLGIASVVGYKMIKNK